MADTVVDFINTTTNYSALTTGVTLVTNSASEQAVVKDIDVVNPLGVTFDYAVGGTTVASSSQSLAGSELVGSSRSMTMKLNPSSFASNNIIYQVNQAASGNNLTTFSHNTIFNKTPAGLSGTYTTSSNVNNSDSTNFFCFDIYGNYYYASNSASGGQGVYKKTGGFAGTAVGIVAPGLNSCTSFDGRYISGVSASSNTGYYYDTQGNSGAGTFTTVAAGTIFQAGSGTGQGCSIDGFMAFRPGNGAQVSLYNLLAQRTVGLWSSDLIPTSTSQPCMAMGKNSKGNYYLLVGALSVGQQSGRFPNSQTLIAWDLGTNLNAPTLFPIPLAYNGAIATSGNINYFQTTSNGLFTYLLGNTPRVINWDTLLVSNALAVTGFSAFTTGSASFLGVDATRANTDFGSIGIRATGIKTT